MSGTNTGKEKSYQPRHLEINDLERIKRFRIAGYRGKASDALHELGCDNTAFAQGKKDSSAQPLINKLENDNRSLVAWSS